MNTHTHDYSDSSTALELTLDEFDTGTLPSLDDLMRELTDQETATAATAKPPTNVAESAAPPPNRANPVSNGAGVEAAARQHERETHELRQAFERVSQDFEKYRWRAERERTDHYAFAVVSIVRQFLPVLDNFERALGSVNDAAAAENQTLANFVSGVEMIYQQNIKYLQDIGVSQLKTVGTEFNPRFHEAVSTEVRTDVAPNTIIEEIMRGYQMGDKLVRPAMVKVSTNQ